MTAARGRVLRGCCCEAADGNPEAAYHDVRARRGCGIARHCAGRCVAASRA